MRYFTRNASVYSLESDKKWKSEFSVSGNVSESDIGNEVRAIGLVLESCYKVGHGLKVMKG